MEKLRRLDVAKGYMQVIAEVDSLALVKSTKAVVAG